MQLRQFAVEGVGFCPDIVASELRTSKAEIAGTIGLATDDLSRALGIREAKPQMRLRQMLEILCRVEGEVGSDLVAYAWFRSEPLPGLGA